MQEAAPTGALLLGLALAAGVCAQNDAEPAQEADGRLTRALTVASELVARPREALADAPALAQDALPLSEEEERAVAALRQEFRAERERRLGELNRTYAARTEKALGEPQAATYRRIIESLELLAAQTQAARQAVAEAAGEDRLPDPSEPLLLATVEPEDLMDLDEEQRRRVRALRDAVYESLGRALREGFVTETWEDPEAWRERREEVRRIQQQAREEFRAGLAEVLEPEQLERRARIEAALEQYRSRLRTARREATDELVRLLAPAAGAAAAPAAPE
jgi:hypothetical protein